MADTSLEANPGTGGARFKVDQVSGTSTPYMKIATTDVVNVIGNVNVSTTITVQGNVGLTAAVPGVSSTFTVNATGGQISSFPIGTTQVNIVSSIALGFTPTGTSFVTLSSSQVSIGGGQQYLDLSATTSPTGTVMMYKLGAANSTMAAVATNSPLPVFQISSVPLAITGTTQVNIVSSIALGFTPTGTSFVTISSSNLLAPLNAISSNIYTDGAAWAENAGKLAVVGGYYSSTAPVLGHGSTGAFLINASSQVVCAPGSAETIVSTTPLVRVGVWNDQGVQVTGFGSGTQYVDLAATSAPTGMVAMFKSGASVSTMVAVASSTPLPVYQISTGPVGPLVGTTQIFGQVSTFANNVASTFVTGSVNQSTTPIPATQGGLDVIWYPSVTTAPRTIKNAAGRLYDIWFTNIGTSAAWLKLYNASSASVSTGTTVPLVAFGLPGLTTSYAVAASGWLGSGFGLQFSTAIAVAVTASSQTTGDTSAPPTNQVNLVFGYR